jgi:adenylate cyclase
MLPHEERRLAAIFVADVVGYSRLVELDETATLAAIKDLRRALFEPLLAEHHGRLVKLTGDGLIAEFGSVVDAVACAAEVQKQLPDRQVEIPAERRIILRIGINLGDVVVDGDDLLGDGVNVAARLEHICPPGSVLISGTVYDHLQGKLDYHFEFAGEQCLKNIRRPVRTYRLALDRTPSSSVGTAQLSAKPTSSLAYPVRARKASLAKMIGWPGSLASVNTMAIRVSSAATTNGPSSCRKLSTSASAAFCPSDLSVIFGILGM